MNFMIKGIFISILSLMLSLVMLPTSAFSIAACGTVAIQSGSLNIRSGPSKTRRVIGKANKGSALSFLGSRGNWYRVKLNNGRIGYARMDYVDESGACSIVTI